MDFLTDLRYRIRLLEHQQLINIKWLQLWLVTIVVTFGSISWTWNHLVAEKDPLSHYPPSLLPINVRKQLPAHGFTNERKARAFAIKDMEIAIIACKKASDKLDESAMDAVTMMKSAAMLSEAVIHFHIFTEDQLYSTFMRELDKWPAYVRHRVSFKFNHVTYPESLLGWKSDHRPCSSFKLFIPHVLKDLDFVLYIDSDTIFLNSLDALWSRLLHFDNTNVMSLATDPEEKTSLPIHSLRPIDSGIIIFDIHRLRHTIFRVPVHIKKKVGSGAEFELANMTWRPNMLHILYKLFSPQIQLPDRDILSILYHFNPDKVYLLPQSWNFCWDYCESYLARVKSKFLNAISKNYPMHSETKDCNAPFLIHGGRSCMDKEKRTEFIILQQSWQQASYGTAKQDVENLINNYLNRSSSNTCFRVNMKLFKKSMRIN